MLKSCLVLDQFVRVPELDLRSGFIVLFQGMISIEFKGKSLHVGDTVRVSSNVIEGAKTRIQTFEGIIISIRGRDVNQTFTVRRIGAKNIGVERSWPLNSTTLVDIVVVKNPKKVRRSKLYFLRNLVGKMSSAI